MNESTEKLARELADKIGTTTEHLWGVLLKQAPISATATLIGLSILAIVAAVAGWKLYSRVKAGNFNESGIVLVVALVLSGVLTLVVGIQELPMIVAGLFNPEYWALKQILGK